MELFRKSDVLKCNLTVKEHIIHAHSIWFMKTYRQLNTPFLVIIEQFVELNHQIGKRLDDQTKIIPHAEIMAKVMYKKKALDYNTEINKQRKKVREDGA